MKNNSEKKAHESLKKSNHKPEDLAKDLKEDLKKSENGLEKKSKRKGTSIGGVLIILVILAILVVIVAFLISTNIKRVVEDDNLTKVITNINTNHIIDINRLGFIPTIIEINKGDTVTWKNQNFSSHKIVFDLGHMENFDIEKQGNYSLTFDESGIYEYHSVTQIYMRGKISVKTP
ncbi:MAG: plastocyanin/azurin family copper-binding protein [Candidatus Pacearchaeota archaeon]|jgi:plastocyanin